jgi:hypothetical protein
MFTELRQDAVGGLRMEKRDVEALGSTPGLRVDELYSLRGGIAERF